MAQVGMSEEHTNSKAVESDGATLRFGASRSERTRSERGASRSRRRSIQSASRATAAASDSHRRRRSAAFSTGESARGGLFALQTTDPRRRSPLLPVPSQPLKLIYSRSIRTAALITLIQYVTCSSSPVKLFLCPST